MMDLLDSPISDAHDASYERKLKQYFQACNNMFDRDTKRGAPLLKIISELGGWKLLGNWKQDWNFNDALKKVQADFGIEALYSIKVRKDYFSSEKADVEIFQSGTSEIMGVDMYLDKRFQNAYKTFIRKVGNLLVNDAITMNITQDNGTTESDLDEFVNDTFTIESRLAKFAFYNTDNFLTNLTALNAESHCLIDWVQQLNYFFGTTNITGATEAKFQNKDFLSDMITSLPAQHMRRMLHNYLIWRVAEPYGLGLSWDYMQTVKSFGKQLTSILVHLDSRYFCILTAENKLEDAMSALYVHHFFNEENKRTVHEITDNIKLALQSQLEKTPWMDATTKQYAKEKLDKTIFRMGYPDWIGNQTYVDVMYSDLTINASDHFDNLISINRFLVRCKRYEFNNQRFWPEDFLFSDFITTLGPLIEENIVFASAGVLQYPIYSSKQPHFASFGSLGAILGRAIHHMIGDIGKDFDRQGHQLSETWWSDASVTAYEKVRTCLTDFCNDATKTDVRRYGRQDIADLTAWINGVRLALIGYKDWVKSRGIVEKVLPGIGLNNEQMILLAHAQTFCYVKDDIPDWLRFSDIQNDDRVNKALGQLKEFSKAFNCKPEAKMNHKGNCGYY
ncbi:endothelin-converting enzyme 1-like [Physella acuta]|uniref:endothelin-converting enzyme 1-like n=1 Tax=Physella acuta TaxID=109671 RepID=UPI0027DEA444|nr:endothelin-converting enzyme 1-like [Physella acuta]